MKKVLLTVTAVALAISAPLIAQDVVQDVQPEEAQIVRVDQGTKMIRVKDEVGAECDLFWSEGTHAEGTASLPELRPGDFVRFDYQVKAGRKILLEIRRSSKVKWLKLAGDVSRQV
jgi:hypothetical protein